MSVDYVDYHVHALGHKGGQYSEELLIPYIHRARGQGIRELGFADHDEYIAGIDEASIASLKTRFTDLNVKLGLEVSYRPGREEEIKAAARRFPFDFLIGSVHDLDSWMFDHPDYRFGYSSWDIAELYRKYYSVLEKLALCGLFDIVGHLDVIKVFGYQPEGDLLPFAEPALQAISRAGLVVEANTAGLHKPCAEIYPSKELLARCFELNIPVTLGSDAHIESEVGRDFAYARELLYQIGYRRLTTFVQRRRGSILL
ncbi:MAG TPA: histidinol-phosphatase HisJ family protein [Syntrophomonadaceae bacterium]|nr:histidinol-phosphatase HisJ family protein [Syntrophomonadaceae bacterium]